MDELKIIAAILASGIPRQAPSMFTSPASAASNTVNIYEAVLAELQKRTQGSAATTP